MKRGCCGWDVKACTCRRKTACACTWRAQSARRVELAADEASAPEGALAFLVAAPRVAEAGGARDVQLRAAGLLMALWMRLFADTA
jgi:hypothetical protein